MLKNTPVQTEVRKTRGGDRGGAMALFGEKYGDSVRVVSIPDSAWSCAAARTCAPPATSASSPSSRKAASRPASAESRRSPGWSRSTAFQRNRDELSALAVALNTRPGELAARIRALQDEHKRLARELQQAKMKPRSAAPGRSADDAIDVAGIKLVAREVAGLDKDGLRALVDQHRDRIKSGVVVLAAPSDGKVTIVVGVTPDLTKKVPAGQVVKQLAPIVGGGGGGRGDFAEAGGKDPSKIGELLAASRAIVEKMLTQRKD